MPSLKLALLAASASCLLISAAPAHPHKFRIVKTWYAGWTSHADGPNSEVFEAEEEMAVKDKALCDRLLKVANGSTLPANRFDSKGNALLPAAYRPVAWAAINRSQVPKSAAHINEFLRFDLQTINDCDRPATKNKLAYTCYFDQTSLRDLMSGPLTVIQFKTTLPHVDPYYFIIGQNWLIERFIELSNDRYYGSEPSFFAWGKSIYFAYWTTPQSRHSRDAKRSGFAWPHYPSTLLNIGQIRNGDATDPTDPASLDRRCVFSLSTK